MDVLGIVTDRRIVMGGSVEVRPVTAHMHLYIHDQMNADPSLEDSCQLLTSTYNNPSVLVYVVTPHRYQKIMSIWCLIPGTIQGEEVRTTRLLIEQ